MPKAPANRRSGILLHPTSLPGPHGAGDLGAAAYHFVDWLVAGRQTLWQVLPLGGIGPGNSPYMSRSAFAGNELLIDLMQLREAGWLSATETETPAEVFAERVNFAAVHPFRMSRLRIAAGRFFDTAGGTAHEAFLAFCAAEAAWLEDYALFMALDEQHGGDERQWSAWPKPLASRQAESLHAAREALADECRFWKFCQWCFHGQWHALRRYANERGIEIIGDVPIFVSAHSADVWSHPGLFQLDARGKPRVVAGVPPDYFSETGQRWGNPLYAWPAHAEEDFRWWIARMRAAMSLYDIVRIDHFRGFESYWEIPAASATAIKGRWRPGPGAALFGAFDRAFGTGEKQCPLRIIAEDLGILTPEVVALREKLSLPGMRILQFAFDGHSDNLYLPHNFEAHTVVYTGTHDNDTSVGWWSALDEESRAYVRRYLGISGDQIHWDLIRAASASVAEYAIVPMQDVLGLDSAHRMNQPGMSEGYWEWRFSWHQVAAWHAERLGELAQLHGRVPGNPESRLSH